jgi:hypothetical protein
MRRTVRPTRTRAPAAKDMLAIVTPDRPAALIVRQIYDAQVAHPFVVAGKRLIDQLGDKLRRGFGESALDALP